MPQAETQLLRMCSGPWQEEREGGQGLSWRHRPPGQERAAQILAAARPRLWWTQPSQRVLLQDCRGYKGFGPGAFACCPSSLQRGGRADTERRPSCRGAHLILELEQVLRGAGHRQHFPVSSWSKKQQQLETPADSRGGGRDKRQKEQNLPTARVGTTPSPLAWEG